MTFTAGDNEEDVLIFLRNDDDSEVTESFFVNLSQLDGTACDTATVVILDDEPTPPPPTTPRMLIVYMYIISYISYRYPIQY